MVEYKYDAWGATLAKTGSMAGTLGVHNPFRYRGYVFDLDTGLYYLKSRYYNPKWGRFINADVLLGKRGALLSHNLFAYCINNPIDLNDSKGCEPEWVKQINGYIISRGLYILSLFERCNVINRNLVSFEFGSGIGFGGNIEDDTIGMGASIKAYMGSYIRYSEGEWSLVNRSGSNVSVTFLGVCHNAPAFIETYEHEYGAEGCTCTLWDTPFVEKRMCPANVVVPTEPFESAASIGFDLEGYCLVGGKVLFNVDINYLYEEYSKLAKEVFGVFFD